MADLAHHAEGDFWQAPVATPGVSATVRTHSLVEASCAHCGTEFVMGAAFCHVCGGSRELRVSGPAAQGWTRYLQFHHIKRAFGLSTASLMAFLLGLGCTLAALLVGFIFSANTVLDWQAVQMWRIEWLLAAVAFFVAGILLRHSSSK
jgi:hypothetical protein